MPGLTTPVLALFAGLCLAFGFLCGAVFDLLKLARNHRDAIDCLRDRIGEIDGLATDFEGLLEDHARLAAAHARLDRDSLEAISKLAVAVFHQGRSIGDIRAAFVEASRAIDENFRTLAADIDELGSDLDEHRAEDRNRRQRLSQLFRFAELETRHNRTRDLAETFHLIAGDVYNPEIDGDPDSDADDDEDDDVDAAGCGVDGDSDDDDDDGPLAAVMPTPPGRAVFLFAPSPAH